MLPSDAEVTVVMEPTRNAWVPLAAWLRRRGARVVLVPPEQAAELRDYYSKHAKSDRLDSQMLARLPLLHPDGLRAAEGAGPAGPLRRANETAGQSGQAAQRRSRPPRRLPGAPRTRLARRVRRRPSAASSYVRLVDDAAEPFVVGVVVAPDDVPADHAGLLFVAGVVGAVQREVPQRGELGFDAV
jgi:hypothetical protein